MDYTEYIWNEYVTMEGNTKHCFKSMLSRVLEKQRELICLALNDNKIRDYNELRNIILDTKLEDMSSNFNANTKRLLKISKLRDYEFFNWLKKNKE